MERDLTTLLTLQSMFAAREPIAMLTAYDAGFASLMDAAGVDVILVGDSLGMVLQGHDSTLHVTLEHLAYHTECVTRESRRAWVITDLPFGSYHGSLGSALRSASTLMKAGAQMVKLEGAGWSAQVAHFLLERGVLVCGHLGLPPQTAHALEGARVQGRDEQSEAQLVRQAVELADAGVSMIVLEQMPARVGKAIQDAVHVPCIGIGAGPDVAGQVLVLQDMLGIARGRLPRFVRNFMSDPGSSPDNGGIEGAIARYVRAVKDRSFPVPGLHTY